MTSHLMKPFQLITKSTFCNTMAKSGISTELSKLPGNYKMTHQTGLGEYYKALNLPADFIKAMTNRKDSEMYLALKEKNGKWSYKSTHLIKGFPVGGNEWSFKIGEKFNLVENDPMDPSNFGRAIDMSVESVEDRLVFKAQEEIMSVAPLPKQCGDGIIITREIKGENVATLKGYFERFANKDFGSNKEPDQNLTNGN